MKYLVATTLILLSVDAFSEIQTSKCTFEISGQENLHTEINKCLPGDGEIKKVFVFIESKVKVEGERHYWTQAEKNGEAFKAVLEKELKNINSELQIFTEVTPKFRISSSKANIFFVRETKPSPSKVEVTQTPIFLDEITLGIGISKNRNYRKKFKTTYLKFLRRVKKDLNIKIGFAFSQYYSDDLKDYQGYDFMAEWFHPINNGLNFNIAGVLGSVSTNNEVVINIGGQIGLQYELNKFLFELSGKHSRNTQDAIMLVGYLL